MVLDRMEYLFVAIGVLLVSFNSFHHPAVYFTLSDMFFTMAIAIRLTKGFPLAPLGEGTLFWTLGVVLLIGGLIIGSIFNGETVRATVIGLQYVFAYALLPMIVLARPYEQAVTLAKLGVWSVALNSSTGLIAYFMGYSAGYDRHFMLVSGGGRVAGLVDNPNGLAGLIVFALPLLWLLALTRAFRPVTAIVLFVILIVTLVLTSSNTGMFGAAVCGLVFLVGLGSIRTMVYTGIGLGVVVVVIQQWGALFLPETFQRRVLDAAQSGDISEAGTFDDRMALMVEAWEILPQYLFVGMGADQYREFSAHNLPVHNFFLLLANEGGLMSLIGIVLILLGAVVAVMMAHDAPHRSITLVAVVSLVVTYASLAMTFAHMYQRSLPLPILLAVGLAVPVAAAALRRRPALPGA